VNPSIAKKIQTTFGKHRKAPDETRRAIMLDFAQDDDEDDEDNRGRYFLVVRLSKDDRAALARLLSNKPGRYNSIAWSNLIAPIRKVDECPQVRALRIIMDDEDVAIDICEHLNENMMSSDALAAQLSLHIDDENCKSIKEKEEEVPLNNLLLGFGDDDNDDDFFEQVDNANVWG
jgi:hypothetical protein